MNAPARPNPESAAITEVILGDSQQAAQSGPVRLRYRKISGEIELAGLVESLTVWD
jgi:hypothetical protein